MNGENEYQDADPCSVFCQFQGREPENEGDSHLEHAYIHSAECPMKAWHFEVRKKKSEHQDERQAEYEIEE